MYISDHEKGFILEYLSNPKEYIEERFFEFLPTVNRHVNGTKITRGKINKDTKKYCRHLIIPQENDVDDIVIPLSSIKDNDPMYHSATIINSKIFFHQNAAEFKELEDVDSSNLLNKFDVNESLNTRDRDYYKDEKIEKVRYVASKKVIKTATDRQGSRYCLTSFSAISGKYMYNEAQVREVVNKISYFRLYSATRNNNNFYKTINIVPYMGKTLLQIINQGNFNRIDLAEKILESYLENIADNEIVHTDIKPDNICVDNDVVYFIDFENSFIINHHQSSGLGTAGFMANEFFKNPEDASKQIEIFAENQDNWIGCLKNDFRSLFTVKTDIFALGKVLEQLNLQESDKYYDLVMQMKHIDPDSRPSTELIRQTINSYKSLKLG